MKVIDIFSKKVISDTSINDYQNDAQEEIFSEKLSYLVHLEGGSSIHKKKVAIQISEASGSFSFVNFMDISEKIKDLSSLESLAGVSLYIPEIYDISLNHLNLIKQYLDFSEIDGPLIITTSNSKAMDIYCPLNDDIEENIFPCSNLEMEAVVSLYKTLFTAS